MRARTVIVAVVSFTVLGSGQLTGRAGHVGEEGRDFRRNGRDAGLAGDDWHWANDAMKGEGAFGLN